MPCKGMGASEVEMIRRRSKPRRGPASIPDDEWRNQEYLTYLRQEGRCVVPGCYSHQMYSGGGICDPAHTLNGGMRQRGPDASCIPLCRRHHSELDQGLQNRNAPLTLPLHLNRREQFEVFYGVDLKAEALRWWKAFQEWLTGPTA